MKVFLALLLLLGLAVFLPFSPFARFGFLGLVCAGYAWHFHRRYTLPLRDAAARAREIAAGNLSREPLRAGGREIGDLARALDVLARDVRRRIGALQDERAEMHALIDTMSEGVLALDAAGDVTRANPAACSLFGLARDPRGLAAEAIDRRPEFLALVRQALGGRAVPPAELRRGERHLVATAQPLRDGGAVFFFLDVSELRRLEDVRRDFVANASHELKTPLTVLRGYVETLEDGELPEPLRRQFLGTVRANVERLQRVVEDLLDLSRIESGGWRIEPSDLSLSAAVRESWAEFCPLARKAKVSFSSEIAPDAERVAADPSALRQILSNLFDNALRYTPPDGSIAVTAERLGDAVRVEIRDTGSGISAVHLPRIFERFYRADSGRGREQGGTGLGLAIVRHLVERHGGEVNAESELGRGTAMTFTLNAADALEAPRFLFEAG